jgi:hypothetical protein
MVCDVLLSVKNDLHLEKYQIRDLYEYCALEFQKSLKENIVVHFCLCFEHFDHEGARLLDLKNSHVVVSMFGA